MSEIILHHYDLSPYAEKIRLALGLKALPWRSVQAPMVMPKPDLIELTGGYRRVPVLQLGADIYCDTHCHRAGARPPATESAPLTSRSRDNVEHGLSRWAETTFMMVMLRFFRNRRRLPRGVRRGSPQDHGASGNRSRSVEGGAGPPSCCRSLRTSTGSSISWTTAGPSCWATSPAWRICPRSIP